MVIEPKYQIKRLKDAIEQSELNLKERNENHKKAVFVEVGKIAAYKSELEYWEKRVYLDEAKKKQEQDNRTKKQILEQRITDETTNPCVYCMHAQVLHRENTGPCSACQSDPNKTEAQWCNVYIPEQGS